MGKKVTTFDFIKKAKEIHGDLYDYSLVNYKAWNKKVEIICKNHGSFNQNPNNHTSGQGCPKCALKLQQEINILTTEEFIRRSNLKHNFKYDYSKAIYYHGDLKVDIICPIHQQFSIIGRRHLEGDGCAKCSLGLSNYKKNDWIKKGTGKLGTFYILKCWNKEEEFYKIGITFTNLNTRYGKNKKKMPYNYEIFGVVEGNYLESIWNLESINKKEMTPDLYIPKIKFPGSTYECFKNLDKLKILY